MIIYKKVFLSAALSLLIFCIFSNAINAEISEAKKKQLEEVNKELQLEKGKWLNSGNPIGEDYRYDYPTDERMKEELKNTMDHIKKAREEMQKIFKKAEVQYKGTEPMTYAKVDLDTESFLITYLEKSASTFTKEVFQDKERKNPTEEGRYRIQLYGQGSIKFYEKTDGSEFVSFYPSGKLQSYSICLEPPPKQITITNMILNKLKTYTVDLEPLEKGYVWEYGFDLDENGAIVREKIGKHSKIEDAENKKKFLEMRKEMLAKELQGFDEKERDEYLQKGGYEKETRAKMIEDSIKSLEEEIQSIEKQIENIE